MGKSLRKRRTAKKVSVKVKEKKAQRKHFHAGQIQDQELRKRFDKSKTLMQPLSCRK